ncbi:MAG: PAS domain S-box protein [Cyclobacteriaceae bacterium]|nr:PAS domain S-box protein [Cyclobacteriaceae bacterium]
MAIGKNVKSDKLIAGDDNGSKTAKKKSSTSAAAASILTQSIETPLDLKVVMDVLDDACLISMTDKKGYITYVNDKFIELAKYTREELIGQNHNIVRHEDMPKAVFKEVWATIGRGDTFKGIIKNKAKDGTPYWVDAWICPVLGPDGKPEKYVGIRYDITEQIKAKEASEDNERRMNGTLDQAVDSVVTINSNKEITFYNKAAERMFGYTAEEVMGKNVRMIVPAIHQKNHDNYVDANLKTGVNKVIGTGRDLEMVRKDGSQFWGFLSLSKVEFEGETQYTAFIKDISAQKAQEAETKAAITKMNETLEQAIDAVITINSNKEVLFFNKVAEKMFGYDRSEVLGNNVKMIVPAIHQKDHDNYVDSNIKTGVNKVIGKGRDLEMDRKDGSTFWGNLSLSKVEVDGEILYTAFIKDITEELRIKEQALSVTSAVDTGYAMIEFTVEGNIINANSNFVSGMGYAHLDEIKGRHHRIFCESEYANSNDYVDFWKSLRAGKVQTGEIKRIKKDGELVWLQASYCPITNEEGKIIKVIKIATDISSVKIPVMKVSEIIRGIAGGDLTTTFDMVADGYVKEMGDALNTAINNLNDLMKNISQSSDVVSDSAGTSLQMVEGMKKNTKEVAAAISQIAKGAQDQAQRTDESAKLVQEVLESANNMEISSEKINKTAAQGQQSSENGLKIIRNLVENMEGISSSAGLTSASIGVLTQRADEIGRTLNVITDIAAQTNLLALNAAIEAARAGDAGRGFAVVAEEIRKLAEDSRKSAIDIEKIIGDVQKDTLSAGKAIETMEKSVKDGNSATRDAESIFEEIAKSSEETFNFSKEIQDATVAQKSSIDVVAKNIEQIVVVAEETAAGAQQVASSSQELNGGMEDIGNSSAKLSEIASELQAGVNQFKLK